VAKTDLPVPLLPATTLALPAGNPPRHIWSKPLIPELSCNAPGSAADIPIDEAYAKLGSEAAAAKILRDRYSP